MLLLTIIFYGALASVDNFNGVFKPSIYILPSKFIALPAKIWIRVYLFV